MIINESRPERIPRPEDVVSYLRSQGWKTIPVEDTNVIALEYQGLKSECPFRVLVPARSDFKDADSTITSIIDLVATIEDRSISDVSTAMSIRYKDVIRKRIIDPVSNESISLGVAAEVVASLKSLFVQAASQEENPANYTVKATKSALKFGDHCRFGHTFHGSFGFVVECPIAPQPLQYQMDLVEQSHGHDIALPFERRVVQRIATGLHDVDLAVRTADPSVLVRNYEKGFNANICEQLAEIGEVLGGSSMEFSIMWSPAWNVNSTLSKMKPVRITPQCVPFLTSAARGLRSSMGESVDRAVSGRVIALRSKEAPSEIDQDELFDNDRVVVILTEVQPGRSLQVHVPLNYEDYKKASEAHITGKIISVSGKLEKDGKFWKLMAPHSFAIGEVLEE